MQISELLFTRNILTAARTYFTLYAIKSWCTTAVKSVHSVRTCPVVLTGMTCAVINICFKGKDEKENYTVMYAIFGLLPGVEDTGHVTIEYCLTNLLFLLFSSFCCPFVPYCFTSTLSSTPSKNPYMRGLAVSTTILEQVFLTILRPA